MKFEFETDDPTVVDIYNLHVEWQVQGKLRKEAGEDLAEVQDELRRKKSYLKFRRGQVAMEYRTGAKEATDANDKVIKITEGALGNLLDSDAELKEIDDEINELQSKVDLCSSYLEAINQKKYALQDEVKLFLSDYWSEPRDPSKEGNYKEKMQEVQKELDIEEQADKIRTRRRRRSSEVE